MTLAGGPWGGRAGRFRACTPGAFFEQFDGRGVRCVLARTLRGSWERCDA